jgi:hypothetical protein
MKFELCKDVVLARDMPEHRLKRGDIVKPVEHHFAADGIEGYSAEVFNALGDTLTIITVPDSTLEPRSLPFRTSKQLVQMTWLGLACRSSCRVLG